MRRSLALRPAAPPTKAESTATLRAAASTAEVVPDDAIEQQVRRDRRRSADEDLLTGKGLGDGTSTNGARGPRSGDG